MILKSVKIFFFFNISLIKFFFVKTNLLYFLDKFNSFKKSHLRSLLFLYDIDAMIYDDKMWINYKSQIFMSNYLKQNKVNSILEYGSGASTVWFSKRAKQVFSFEHSKKWFEKISYKLKNYRNTKIFLIPPQKNINKKYSSSKLPNYSFKNYVIGPKKLKKKFDIIFIDGRCRSECLKLSYNKLLKKNGIIVLDNSDRKEYQSSVKWLSSKCKKVVEFFDHVPTIPFKEQTKFFFC